MLIEGLQILMRRELPYTPAENFRNPVAPYQQSNDICVNERECTPPEGPSATVAVSADVPSPGRKRAWDRNQNAETPEGWEASAGPRKKFRHCDEGVTQS